MKLPTVKTLICATILSTGIVSPQALTAPYVGAALGSAKIDNSELRNDVKNKTLFVFVGHRFNNSFALEARMGSGIQSDTVRYNEHRMSVKTGTFMGVYGKALLPLEGRITPYIIAGVTRGTTTSSVNGYRQKDTDSDVSYGLGADWDITPSATLNIEYMNWFHKDHTDMRGINLGAKLRF